ncbi:unnamed protein product [Arctogadus glacialis]
MRLTLPEAVASLVIDKESLLRDRRSEQAMSPPSLELELGLGSPGTYPPAGRGRTVGLVGPRGSPTGGDRFSGTALQDWAGGTGDTMSQPGTVERPVYGRLVELPAGDCAVQSNPRNRHPHQYSSLTSPSDAALL